MICSQAADVLPLSCQTRVYVLPSMGADVVVWELLNWMHALSIFLLSEKVMDCSGSSLSLQEVRGCCNSSGLVAGGLPVVKCRATCCEHTHSRSLSAAAGREPCPACQGFCYLALVLPVFTSSVPQGLILKAAACCHV